LPFGLLATAAAEAVLRGPVGRRQILVLLRIGDRGGTERLRETLGAAAIWWSRPRGETITLLF
jgi:hypothetical protein